MHTHHTLQNVRISRDEQSWGVRIEADIPWDTLSRYRTEALKEIQKDAKLDGFRPGHAPESRILEIYGESAVLKRAAESAVSNELPDLLAHEKFLIIAAPSVHIAQPESGKPLSFTAQAPLAPEVTLPDYKAIVSALPMPEEVSVSDEEHAEALTHLRRERSRIEKIESGSEPQKAHEESRAMDAADLPVLDDAFVQSLGYENAAGFENTLRENIKHEKTLRGKEKRRAEILDALLPKATIHYPSLLREYEINDIASQAKHEAEHAGLAWDQYLSHIKKTEEEFRTSLGDAADKRAKVRLLLAEIARKESIEADQERLAQDFEQASRQYPTADKEALRAHIAHALRNEAVMSFLENLKA